MDKQEIKKQWARSNSEQRISMLRDKSIQSDLLVVLGLIDRDERVFREAKNHERLNYKLASIALEKITDDPRPQFVLSSRLNDLVKSFVFNKKGEHYWGDGGDVYSFDRKELLSLFGSLEQVSFKELLSLFKSKKEAEERLRYLFGSDVLARMKQGQVFTKDKLLMVNTGENKDISSKIKISNVNVRYGKYALVGRSDEYLSFDLRGVPASISKFWDNHVNVQINSGHPIGFAFSLFHRFDSGKKAVVTCLQSDISNILSDKSKKEIFSRLDGGRVFGLLQEYFEPILNNWAVLVWRNTYKKLRSMGVEEIYLSSIGGMESMNVSLPSEVKRSVKKIIRLDNLAGPVMLEVDGVETEVYGPPDSKTDKELLEKKSISSTFIKDEINKEFCNMTIFESIEKIVNSCNVDDNIGDLDGDIEINSKNGNVEGFDTLMGTRNTLEALKFGVKYIVCCDSCKIGSVVSKSEKLFDDESSARDYAKKNDCDFIAKVTPTDKKEGGKTVYTVSTKKRVVSDTSEALKMGVKYIVCCDSCKIGSVVSKSEKLFDDESSARAYAKKNDCGFIAKVTPTDKKEGGKTVYTVSTKKKVTSNTNEAYVKSYYSQSLRHFNEAVTNEVAYMPVYSGGKSYSVGDKVRTNANIFKNKKDAINSAKKETGPGGNYEGDSVSIASMKVEELDQSKKNVYNIVHIDKEINLKKK